MLSWAKETWIVHSRNIAGLLWYSRPGDLYRRLKPSGVGRGCTTNMRKLDQTWSVRGAGGYKDPDGSIGILHTYLEGVIPFMYWGYGL